MSRKESNISVNLDPAFKDQLVLLAKHNKLKPTEWARAALISAINRQATFDRIYVETGDDIKHPSL